MKFEDMEIIIDTREQKPYDFSPLKARKKKLDSGDYSVVGYHDEIVVERKSLPDLIGSLTKGRARFEREIVRLQEYKRACVVVEADYRHLWKQPYYARNIRPLSIVNSVTQWSSKYNIPFFMCSDRVNTRHFILNYLWGYIKQLK